jgi:hypothetical protein
MSRNNVPPAEMARWCLGAFCRVGPWRLCFGHIDASGRYARYVPPRKARRVAKCGHGHGQWCSFGPIPIGLYGRR